MLTSTSTKAVNRGYWDPSESMLAYARTKDANATQNNYFQIVSTRRLGQTQTVQFQSGNQYGTNWIWGSKCTADNTCSDSNTVANNALAEMPRSYHEGNNAYGDYYNWYAATAESGNYSTYNATATDSICPKGWQLSYGGRTNYSDKTWAHLIETAYGLDSSNTSLLYLRTRPISLVNAGRYSYNTGVIDHASTEIWDSGVYAAMSGNTSKNADHLATWGTIFYVNYSDKTLGFSIRCVKK